jgi:hypothetical protein
MTIYHMTKSTLESELHRVKTYQADCDDYEHCEQYQEEIDAFKDALRCGEGSSFAFGYSKYVMDTCNFTEEL